MPITLNHTIVYSKDKRQGADFLTDLFGLPPAPEWGPFITVQMANGRPVRDQTVEPGTNSRTS